jgi:hypothetical protein
MIKRSTSLEPSTSLAGKDRGMSDLQMESTKPKKGASGIWVLLIFVFLFAGIIALGVLTQ